MFHYSRHKSIDLAAIYRRLEGIAEELPLPAKKRRRIRAFRWWRMVFIAVALSVFTVVGAGIYLAVVARGAYADANRAKDDLVLAVSAVRSKDYRDAEDAAGRAGEGFDLAYAELGRIASGTPFDIIPFIAAPVNEARRLVSAAANIAWVVEGASGFAADIKERLTLDDQRTYDQITTEEKRLILETVGTSGPLFRDMSIRLDAVAAELSAMSRSTILWPFRSRLVSLQGELGPVRDIMSKAEPLSRVLPAMLGHQEAAEYLLILQNTDELRPTGGFIGTFGTIAVKDAELVSFSTHDIYHLDMPVKDLVALEPPAPLRRYLKVDKWFLRDANWSPDWRRSADRIEDMYRTELAALKRVRGGKPDPVIASAPASLDGVIALTPAVFTDILRIVGPVTIDGTVYDADNFHRLLEYKVEKGYIELGTPSWQRKEEIGRIAVGLEKSLSRLPAGRWLELAESLDRRLASKDIMFRMKDQGTQAILKELRLTGEFPETGGDQILVVDANLAALKTDAVMTRSIDYRLEQSPSGIKVRLAVAYSHQGTVDWRTSRYQSYLRIYVPAGSRLVSSQGPIEKPLVSSDEDGRTVFSGFVVIPPGESGQVAVEYELPDQIVQSVADGRYRLHVQRQPGTRVSELTASFDFLRPIAAISPSGFSSRLDGTGSASWRGNFTQDREFNIELKKD